MEVELVNEFPAVSDDNFLANYELGERLRGSSGSEIREFGVKSRQFLDSLVTHLLSLVFASSSVSQGLYCFCPELLLEGDDVAVLDLFGKLLKVFSDSGFLTSVEVAEAREEFATFVVEIRLSHKSSKQRAEDIPDIISYLSKSYILLQRRSLLRVFQLSCLVVDMPLLEMPVVDIDLSDCQLRPLLLTSCLRSVQSYVLSKSYQQKSLFTSQTLDAVREAIRNSTNFLQGGCFNPWSGVCQREKQSFIEKYRSLYLEYVSRKQKKRSHERKSSGKSVSFSGDVVSKPLVSPKSSAVVASSSRSKPVKPAVIVRNEAGEPMIASSSGVKSLLQSKKKPGEKLFSVSSPKGSRVRDPVVSSSREVPSGSSRGRGRAGVVQGTSSGKGRKNKKSGDQDPNFSL